MQSFHFFCIAIVRKSPINRSINTKHERSILRRIETHRINKDKAISSVSNLEISTPTAQHSAYRRALARIR